MTKTTTLRHRVRAQEADHEAALQKARDREEAQRQAHLERARNRQRLRRDVDDTGVTYSGTRLPCEETRVLGSILVPILGGLAIAGGVAAGYTLYAPELVNAVGWTSGVLLAAYVALLHVWRVRWTLRIEGDVFAFHPGWHPLEGPSIGSGETIGRLEKLRMYIRRPSDGLAWANLRVAGESWEGLMVGLNAEGLECAETLEKRIDAAR